MGLDQDAFVKIDDRTVNIGCWRKHYPLQRVFVELAGQDINCKDIELTLDMLEVIETSRDKGHWYIDSDEYRWQDHAFIVGAKGYLMQAYKVYYSSNY